MTPRQFRKIALGFEGAVENAHMGHPDFRAANGKIFATLHADAAHGMVKLPIDQQQRFVREHPASFAPAAGAWGQAGSTIVTLAHIDEETLGEALTLAWQNLQTPARRTSPSAKKASKPPGRGRRASLRRRSSGPRPRSR